jgi:hypothetical protein
MSKIKLTSKKKKINKNVKKTERKAGKNQKKISGVVRPQEKMT